MMMLDMPPVQASQVEMAVLRDVRTVHDVASVCDVLAMDPGLAGWVLADVTPTERSGSATIPGAVIDTQTGALNAPEDAEAVVVKEGAWAMVAADDEKTTDRQGRFNWTEPVAADTRGLSPEMLYSPFAHGGTILFQPCRDKTGIEFFAQVGLIFPEWSDGAETACRTLQHDRALFASTDGAVAGREQLVKLCRGDSSLLSAVALHQLARSDRATPELIRAALVSPDRGRRAVAAYSIASATAGNSAAMLLEEVTRAVDAAPAAEELRPIAIGAFSASLLHRGDSSVAARGRAILERVRARCAQLGAEAEQDPALTYILDRVRPEPTQP